jgi:hypothetical protein
MRRLFWNRSVYRVRRSLKVKTGQSTTSFHPATGNPITTSTISNRYADPVTDESKTVSYKESHGATRGLSRVGKPLWVRVALALNDLLPRSIRPVKSKRARYRRWYGWRTQVLAWRINWRSIHKNRLMNKLGLRHGTKLGELGLRHGKKIGEK